MPSSQKIVQTVLRWTTPLLVLAALGGTTIDGIFAAGTIWTAPRATLLSNSPAGDYRVLLYRRDTDSSPATQLVVEHHWHTIFLGRLVAIESVPEATLRASWTNASTLHIACTGCDHNATDLPDRNWGKLHLSYDLQ